MITEMVVRVSYADVESYPSVEFLQILLHVTATLQDEIHYVQIAIASLRSGS